MYLKEIKIMGFKSFADKTSISLEQGITGIVGPNGSGKSNIVDAVRWVLGEQSVKSLRGEGMMSDVIFSGSKSRNPQGIASVTLIFNNEDNHLPISSTEVQIKRAVYKTGENEYYLNNEKCRLKDITDLFMDSGAGRESFNIISQGKISEILSTKPEDRRMIFEEAAGVLKYKKRKEEALRKLDRTHDNMKRVKDIMAELSVQLEPLKEQSEKATKYLEAKNELESIEIALSVHDIEKLHYEYEKDKKRIEELSNDITKSNTEESLQESDMQSKKLELGKLNDKIYHESQLLVELSAKKERLNGEKKIVVERKQMQVDDQKLHDSLLELQEQQLKTKNDIHALEQDIVSRNLELGSIDTAYFEASSKIDEKKRQEAKVKEGNTINSRELFRIRNEIDSLVLSIESNSKVSNAVREVLNNPRLHGIHNMIGKLIDMKEEYMTSIEVALGSAREFLVVDDENSAKEAINYLKNSNSGRATFFPLNVIKPRGIDTETMQVLSSCPGFIDIASNLVTFDENYRNIILNQLGNVIIVDNLDHANMMARKINNRYRIVTLEGELISVGGSITGGHYRKTSNMFKEKYELERLRKVEVDLRSKLESEEKLLQELQKDIQGLEQKNYEITREKIRCTEELQMKNRLKEQYQTSLDNLTKQLEGLQSTLDNTLDDEEVEIMKSLYECEQALQEKMRIVDDLTNERNRLNETISELETLRKKQNSLLQKNQEEAHKLEVRVGRAEVKLDSLLAYLNEEYSMTYEKAKEEYLLEIDEDEARSKVSSIKSVIRSLGEVNTGSIAEYERVSKRYEFLTNQEEDLGKAEDTLLEIIKEMDEIMEVRFKETFDEVRKQFKETFKELFGGGTGDLKLTSEEELLTTGIEIIVSPPGKKLQHISLLSGGEKTLTAIALLFAILRTRPVPFCILDEVEAALDEANVDNFGNYLSHFRNTTQFVIITHKKKTMEYADVLYGITMQESGVSKLVSVRLQDK